MADSEYMTEIQFIDMTDVMVQNIINIISASKNINSYLAQFIRETPDKPLTSDVYNALSSQDRRITRFNDALLKYAKVSKMRKSIKPIENIPEKIPEKVPEKKEDYEIHLEITETSAPYEVTDTKKYDAEIEQLTRELHEFKQRDINNDMLKKKLNDDIEKLKLETTRLNEQLEQLNNPPKVTPIIQQGGTMGTIIDNMSDISFSDDEPLIEPIPTPKPTKKVVFSESESESEEEEEEEEDETSSEEEEEGYSYESEGGETEVDPAIILKKGMDTMGANIVTGFAKDWGIKPEKGRRALSKVYAIRKIMAKEEYRKKMLKVITKNKLKYKK